MYYSLISRLWYRGRERNALFRLCPWVLPATTHQAQKAVVPQNLHICVPEFCQPQPTKPKGSVPYTYY